jgi:hypothetical protein
LSNVLDDENKRLEMGWRKKLKEEEENGLKFMNTELISDF